MSSLGLVMLGGALGAGARYLTSLAAAAMWGATFPWGTLAANLIGGFLMGLLIGGPLSAQPHWVAFLGIGVLGGFTTFSSFSLETLRMLERGAWVEAGLYIGASVIGAIAACAAGMAAAKAFTP
jgi:fluoride exporter